MTTEEMWLERVKEWRGSGRSAPRFCAGKGYTDGTLRYWASRLKRAGAVVEAGQGEGEVRMARVVQVRAPEVQGSETAESETAIVIEVGGARVGVRRGFDREALREVLSVLGGRR